MLSKLSYLTRSLALLVIILTIFILTVVILRTPPKFFIYLLQEDITGGFVRVLLPPTSYPTPTPIPTPLTTFLPSQNPDKKIFRNITAGFEVEVPEGWNEDGGRLYGQDRYRSMMYTVQPAEFYSQKEGKNLSFTDPLLYEQALVDSIGECIRDCVVARHSKNIIRDGVKGIRFETRSRKDREDNDQGYTDHYVSELFILSGRVYRFSSWQVENPNNFWIDRYPQDRPTPLDYFDQIMSTLKFL